MFFSVCLQTLGEKKETLPWIPVFIFFFFLVLLESKTGPDTKHIYYYYYFLLPVGLDCRLSGIKICFLDSQVLQFGGNDQDVD